MATEQELIIKLRAKTDRLQKDLNKAKSKMRGFQKNINKIGADIRNTMLTAFGGAAILQGISAAVGSLADFEFQMSKLKAISGATGDEFDSLKKDALGLGRTTKFTAGEIAKLQLELSKLGFDTGQILASTDAIRKLAAVADADLAQSAKTLAGTLNSFNLEASESERVANTMAEAFSKSALDLEKFTVATANSGAIAQVLGVTLESNTARLGALVDANIDASKAGTDLRKIYLDLNAAGISYDEALIKVANSSDKAGEAQRLVGIRAAGALVILSQQVEKVNELTKALKDDNLELDTMVDIMEDNLITDWKLFKSAIDGIVQKGSALNKILRGITQGLTDLANGVADASRELSTAPIDQFKKGFEDTKKAVKAFTDEEFDKEFERLRVSLEENILAFEIWNNKIERTTESAVDAARGNLIYQGTIDNLKGSMQAITDTQEKQTQAVIDGTEALRKLNREALISFLNQRNKKAGTPSAEGAFSIEGGVDLPQITPEDVEVATINNAKQFAAFQSDFEKQTAGLAEMMEFALKDVAARSIVSGLTAIGNAIGGGGASIENGFAAIGQILAEGMQSLGAAMVAWGVAKIALDIALKSSNGYVALAAGGALIVAGAALSAAINKSQASSPIGGPGSSAGTGGGGTGSFNFDRQGQSIDLTGNFMVSGTNLQLVLDNQARQDNRNVAG